MPTIIAVMFAIGFYSVTSLGIARTRRLTGRNPVIIFRTGTAEEIAAVVVLWLFPLVLVLSTLMPEAAPFRPFIDSPGLRATGALLLLGGLVLQYISIVTLGRAFSIGLDPEKQEHLVKHGPYRYVRHPIYAAFLGFFVGAWLLQPNRFFSIAMPVAIARVVLQAVREERMLLDRFGEQYREYMKSTTRFIPGIL